MQIYRDGDGRVYRVMDNPAKKKHRCQTKKCKRKAKLARIKREVHHHAKEAARETISGAAAVLVGVVALALIGGSISSKGVSS